MRKPTGYICSNGMMCVGDRVRFDNGSLCLVARIVKEQGQVCLDIDGDLVPLSEFVCSMTVFPDNPPGAEIDFTIIEEE